MAEIMDNNDSRMDKMRAKQELIIKTAAATEIQQKNYGSPFLSLSDMNMPTRMNDLFKWCKYFYTFDPIIHGAVNALASFPVTPLSLEESNEYLNEDRKVGEQRSLVKESDLMKSVKYTLFQRVKIYKLLMEIGIDYFLYGNCFVVGEMSPNLNGEQEWKTMFRVSPNRISIDVSPSGATTYKIIPSPEIAELMAKKTPKKAYDEIPEIIKKAVRENKSYTVKSDRIYHFKKAGDSLLDSAWGMPGVVNVLKLLMYRNILRQAQEALAREHIVPLRIFYLNPVNGLSPAGAKGVNGTTPERALAEQIDKATTDPNYKIVSSVPIGMTVAGGQGRGLLLTPEIDQIQSEILAGLNVPREFIFGGVSFSGSSISLKILENHFITYRILLEDFINNFLIKEVAKSRGQWVTEDDDDKLIKAKLTDLKMQDDVQQKQVMMNLNASGKISDAMLLKALGLDPQRVFNEIRDESDIKAEMERYAMMNKLTTDTAIKKATMVQQYQLMMFQRKMDEFLAQGGSGEKIDMLEVDEIVKMVEDSISAERLEVVDYQQSKQDEKETKKKEDYSEIAGHIIDNFKRDPAYGEALLKQLGSKLGSTENYVGLLMTTREMLELDTQPEMLMDLANLIDQELIAKGGTSFDDVVSQRQMEAEQAAMEQQMAAQGEQMQADPNAQSQDPNAVASQGIDMRPMPNQKPPQRKTLG